MLIIAADAWSTSRRRFRQAQPHRAVTQAESRARPQAHVFGAEDLKLPGTPPSAPPGPESSSSAPRALRRPSRAMPPTCRRRHSPAARVHAQRRRPASAPAAPSPSVGWRVCAWGRHKRATIQLAQVMGAGCLAGAQALSLRSNVSGRTHLHCRLAADGPPHAAPKLRGPARKCHARGFRAVAACHPLVHNSQALACSPEHVLV